jgi:FAD/FMN-containing dehydrogenase
VLFGVAIAPEPQLARLGHRHAERLVSALEPWTAGQKYLNFVEEPTDAAGGYRPENWARLRSIRDAVDPDGVFHANHPVPRTR